ncbi:hypothetical protein PUN28_005551 [Cardiocondyla obscurior]|uniref:Uncharacterized protein n=1 Tax=Cardiocondyla obscurior TaxID=286306 RepID=A0AAW2GIG3_9HYME
MRYNVMKYRLTSSTQRFEKGRVPQANVSGRTTDTSHLRGGPGPGGILHRSSINTNENKTCTAHVTIATVVNTPRDVQNGEGGEGKKTITTLLFNFLYRNFI